MESDAEDQKPILPVRISIFHAAQDDPKKNTALRLKRRGFARIVTRVRFLPKRAIVLNHLAKSRSLRQIGKGWNSLGWLRWIAVGNMLRKLWGNT